MHGWEIEISAGVGGVRVEGGDYVVTLKLGHRQGRGAYLSGSSKYVADGLIVCYRSRWAHICSSGAGTYLCMISRLAKHSLQSESSS